MLNKILPLIFAISTTVSAQEVTKLQKTVECMETELVITRLVKDYQELPLWGSQLTTSSIAVFVNPTTKTWTLLQWNNKLACVIDSGTNYTLKWPGKNA